MQQPRSPNPPPALAKGLEVGAPSSNLLAKTRRRNTSFTPTWTPRAADAFSQLLSEMVNGCLHTYDLWDVLDCGCFICSCHYKEVVRMQASGHTGDGAPSKGGGYHSSPNRQV